MNQRKRIKNDRGITLIALVVTIIVLIILAGVSIKLVLGENGIIQKTRKGQEDTLKAQEEEGIQIAVAAAQIEDGRYDKLTKDTLQSAIDTQFGIGRAIVSEVGNDLFAINFTDSKRSYKISSKGTENVIDWNEAMKNAVAPESQDENRNNGYIALGTDGNPVDLDNWNYVLYNGTYALNLEDVVTGTSSSAGYIGEIDSNGEIVGKMPTYIKGPEDKEFIKVTNLRGTFYNIKDLKKAPELPLYTENMRATFSNCIGLEKAPEIPSTVTNMRLAFYKCSSLVTAPSIPSKVKNMRATFSECSNLVNPPNIIPSSVNNLISTFNACFKLQGNIEINASVQGIMDSDDNDIIDYTYCFGNAATESSGLIVTGTSSLLNEIIATKSSTSNIIKGSN